MAFLLNGYLILQLYPKTQIELHLSDEYVDLVQNRIDLAFRFGNLSDSTLVARKLSSTRRIVCASPSYLSAAGEPKHAKELSQFDCIVAQRQPYGAKLEADSETGKEVSVKMNPRLAVVILQR